MRFSNRYIPSLLIAFFLATASLSGCTNSLIAEKHTMKKTTSKPTQDRPLVIAHRGASGYAPEHSLVAKAMAHSMDVDYIEQDVVMTKDDHLVVLHDPYLDRVTNVMTEFPNRFREVFGQKRWLAIDFTLAEIKTLKMTEGFDFDHQTNTTTPLYPNRFPLFKSSFSVSTLQEEIELIQGLNHSRGKDIGIYVEVKAPWFHLIEGKDISLKTLEVLKHYGYTNKQHKAYFQCFDPDETKRVHDELLPQLKMDIKLIQLIAHTGWNETMRLKDGKLVPYSYDWLLKKGSMKTVAEYADGIGPWMPMLVSTKSSAEKIIPSVLLQEARKNDLKIHPYTFRKEKQKIPKFAKDFDHLLDIFIKQLEVDGVFSDHPDSVIDYLENH